MATPAKKQSFLGGAAILTAAVVIVKLIGAAYKIPLSNILGSAGQTYFDTAYQIYNFLLTFSTAGLPLAISRMTSQAHAQGLENEKRKIFRTSIWLFFGLGLVCSVLMLLPGGRAGPVPEQLSGLHRRAGAGSGRVLRVPAGLYAGLHPGTGQHDPHRHVSQVLEALLQAGHWPAAGMVCAAHRPDCRAERRRGHCRRHSRHGRLHAVPLCLSGYP